MSTDASNDAFVFHPELVLFFAGQPGAAPIHDHGVFAGQPQPRVTRRVKISSLPKCRMMCPRSTMRRSPGNIARQIYYFQTGDRGGASAALMKGVVEKLTGDDVIAIAAYVSSLEP